MIITDEIDFSDFEPWSGAVYAHTRICEEGKGQLAQELIEELYPDGLSATQLNDLLWFDSEWLFETLEIDE